MGRGLDDGSAEIEHALNMAELNDFERALADRALAAEERAAVASTVEALAVACMDDEAGTGLGAGGDDRYREWGSRVLAINARVPGNRQSRWGRRPT